MKITFLTGNKDKFEEAKQIIPANKDNSSISFDTTIPVFSWFIAKGMAIGLLIFLSVFAFMAILAIANGGKFSDLTPDIYFALGFVGLIFFFTYVVMIIMFPNGFMSKIKIDDKGISQVSLSTKKVNRAAIIGGIIAKSPGAVGAGMLAEAGDYREVSWKEMKVARINSNSRYMYFSMGRFGLFPVGFFCPKDKYKPVISIVTKYYPNLILS